MASVEQQIEELENMRLPELQRRYLEIVGEESRCPNKAFLIRRIRQTLDGEAPNEETVTEQVEIPADEQSPTTEEPAVPPAPILALKRRKTQTAVTQDKVRGRFKSMTIEELQAMYLDRVGRGTGSDNRSYLVWKIREAEKGRIPIGPRSARQARQAHQEGNSKVRILPIRLEEQVVEKMDAAWRGQGMKTRMEFFRRAIGQYLAQIGESDVAALFD